MKGFTLLEVIIAMTILVVGVVGLLGGFSLGLNSNQNLQHQTLATKACQEMMEQLKAMDFANLPAQNGLLFDTFEIKEERNGDNLGNVIVADVSGGLGNVLEITVTVSNTAVAPAVIPPFSARLVSRRSR
ncbi:MAG: prepilin-type N-terminal cleavage/methylation domain-containing protein [Planctomycetes bacterium]|nr:prepilin-type N-terminal cleavage/methylation domain-containing protein [Planctomycetota bacterium]